MCPVIKPQTSFVFVYQHTLKQTFFLPCSSIPLTRQSMCFAELVEVCVCAFVLFEGHRSVLLTDLLWLPASSSWGTNSIRQTHLDCHRSSPQLITNHWPPLGWRSTFSPSVFCFFQVCSETLSALYNSACTLSPALPFLNHQFLCICPLKERKSH